MSTDARFSPNFPSPPAGKTGWPWDTPIRRLPEKMPNGQPWPKISVVTPAYNQAQYLEETIRSVLLQGYPNLEYIVIDDEATDHTPEIIQKYEPWLAYTARQKNRGQGNAINHGFRFSSGELMGWLNSDDVLLPRALERSALARRRDPKVKVTCGFRQVIDSQSKLMRDWIHPLPEKFDLARCCYIAQETVLWNREVWEKVGPLEEHWRVILDYEYWQRLMAHGYEFTLLPYFLGQFRSYAQGKTSAMADAMQRECETLYARYVGREMTVWDAFEQSNLWIKYRLLRGVPRRMFHSALVSRAVLRWVEIVSGVMQDTQAVRTRKRGQYNAIN
ncbi:MAG: glycosyltransferase [Acidobacteriia bacterium]|nr:glycosyltransferase [Terriglobia bacterium]